MFAHGRARAAVERPNSLKLPPPRHHFFTKVVETLKNSASRHHIAPPHIVDGASSQVHQLWHYTRTILRNIITHPLHPTQRQRLVHLATPKPSSIFLLRVEQRHRSPSLALGSCDIDAEVAPHVLHIPIIDRHSHRSLITLLRRLRQQMFYKPFPATVGGEPKASESAPPTPHA